MGYKIVFCDAARYYFNTCKVKCARVAPLKKITIPKIELTAATLAVRISKKIINCLQCQIDRVYYWTDSMCVLRYIANERSRFQTFVANRVSVIRDGSELQQWQYIDSKHNPADTVSRGIGADDLIEAKQWIEGPEFLWLSPDIWPQTPVDVYKLSPEDPELKRCSNAVVVQDDTAIDQLLTRYPEAMSGHVKKSSTLYKLNPVLFDGVLRIGGRLENAFCSA